MTLKDNILYKGTITSFLVEKNYGFIESLEEESYFFFIDNSKISGKDLKLRHKFRSGDEVEFKVKLGLNKRELAYDLVFLGNPKRDTVIAEAKELNILKGYLKKIDDSYFVKHTNTYLFIPLNISPWEADIDIVYEERLNQLVTFELRDIDKPFKISATLTDRVYKPEYSIINEIKSLDTTTFATITGSNKDGYFTTLLDGSINSFITFKFNNIIPTENKFKVGDVLEVKIGHFSPESGQVNLLLHHEKEEVEVSLNKSFTFKKEHFGSSVIEKKKSTTIERTHGIVVNALANKLTSLNYHIGNDKNRDLLIHNGNYEIVSIFEIKTSASTQSIYTAVGQLLIYSISINSLKGLFIVLPDLLKPKIKDKLEELNIKPIYYSWHYEQPKFHNLDLMKKYFT